MHNVLFSNTVELPVSHLMVYAYIVLSCFIM